MFLLYMDIFEQLFLNSTNKIDNNYTILLSIIKEDKNQINHNYFRQFIRLNDKASSTTYEVWQINNEYLF